MESRGGDGSEVVEQGRWPSRSGDGEARVAWERRRLGSKEQERLLRHATLTKGSSQSRGAQRSRGRKERRGESRVRVSMCSDIMLE